MAQDSRVSINPLGAQSLSRGGGKGMMGGQALAEFISSTGSNYQKMLQDMVKLTQRQAESNEASQLSQQEGLRDIINQMTRKAEQERSIEASTEAREHSATLNRETTQLQTDAELAAAKEIANQDQQIEQQTQAYIAKVKGYKTKVGQYRTMLAMERKRIDSLGNLPFAQISALKLTLGVRSGKPKVIRGYAVINRLNLLLRHAETFEGPFMQDPPFLRAMQSHLQTTIGKIRQQMDYEDLETFKHEPFMLPVPTVKGAEGEPDLLEDFRDFRHHQFAGGYSPTGTLDFEEGDPRWNFISPHNMEVMLKYTIGRATDNKIRTLAGREHEINKRGEALLEALDQHTKYSEQYDGSVLLYESKARDAFEKGTQNFAMSLEHQAVDVLKDQYGQLRPHTVPGEDASSWENPAKSLQKFIMIELLGSADAYDYMEKMGVPGNGIDLTSPMQGLAAMNYTAALDVYGDWVLGMAEGKPSFGLASLTKSLSRHPQLVKKFFQAYPDVALTKRTFGKDLLVTDPKEEGGTFLASTVMGLLEKSKATSIKMSAIIENSTAWRKVEEAGGVIHWGIDANALRSVTLAGVKKDLMDAHLADGKPLEELEYGAELGLLTDELSAIVELARRRGPGLGMGDFMEQIMSADLPDPTGITGEVDAWIGEGALTSLRADHDAMEADRIEQHKIHQASFRKRFAPTQGLDRGIVRPEPGPPTTPGPVPGQAPGPEMGPPAPPTQPAPQDIPVTPPGPGQLQGP